MKRFMQAWHYFLTEPFNWLFCCFFQPIKFKNNFEVAKASQRAVLMFRLSPPMFLISFPIALVGKIVFYNFLHIPVSSTLVLVVVTFVVGSIIWSILWAMAGNVADGIIGGLAVAVACGIAGNSSIGGVAGGYLGAIVGGFLGGLSGSIIGASKKDIELGMIAGGLAGVVGGLGGVFLGGISGCILGGITGSLFAVFVRTTEPVEPGSGIAIIGLLAMIEVIGLYTNFKQGSGWERSVGLFVGICAGILGVFIWSRIADLDWQGDRLGDIVRPFIIAATGSIGALLVRDIASHEISAIVSSLVAILILNVLLGTGSYTGISIVLSFLVSVMIVITLSISLSIIWGMVIGTLFIISYILGYTRLLLYPISSISVINAYLFSRDVPNKVFFYLESSSLYWDEKVFLLLPYLQSTLFIGIKMNSEQTLKQIDFILRERPYQKNIARAILQEMALQDLERKESLRQIAQASQDLDRVFPRELRLHEAKWVEPFLSLDAASQEATKYYEQLNWQKQDIILEQLLRNLTYVNPYVAFSDVRMNKRLADVVHTWQVISRHELENLRNLPRNVQIKNPYQPGNVLEPYDSLFVGRSEIAQSLVEALQRVNPPAFFLNGERRMGKTSIIKQLPAFLGTRYIPVFYDLQTSGVTANAAALLDYIVERISEELTLKGIGVKKLDYEYLEEVGRHSENEIYYHLNRKFREIEQLLRQKERVLLLAFDEFEELAVAGQKGKLDPSLLLGWVRSTIQNSKYVALLFSGVKTVSDIPSWAGYFVNVEDLHVSFLHSDEAYQLITHPSIKISEGHPFSQDVAEEIIHLTNCQPFLIHTICAELITLLNSQKRIRAELKDVKEVIPLVLKKWNSYFWDLWERSDPNQKQCLSVLQKSLAANEIDAIQQQTGLDEQIVYHTVKMLMKRDLIRQSQSSYHIAIPLFSQWMARNVYIPSSKEK